MSRKSRKGKTQSRVERLFEKSESKAPAAGAVGLVREAPAPTAEKRKPAISNRDLMALSIALSRQALGLGYQYGSYRDMYNILGYPTEIEYDDYLGRYERQDISGRIVDLPAVDTWRKAPIVSDGNSSTAQENPKSTFIQGLRWMIEKRRLWHYFQRADRVAGIGRYGVLLIGIKDGKPLEEAALAGSLSKPGDLLYFSVFSENSATIDELEADPSNERYGQPKMYTLDMGEGLADETVAWNRTLHLADDLLEDEVYGRPRLQRVFNRLNDMEKITGGGSEATWKVMYQGLHADVRDGFTTGGQSADDLNDEIDEYIHGLRRFIRTQGVDVKALGSSVVDPTGLYNIIIGLIAAAADIPQRILVGSERGDLASTQDAATWAGQIVARQTGYAEPVILRPFIDRMIMLGALPQPDSGRYSVEWPPLFEMSSLQKVELADKVASAVQKIAPPGAPDMVMEPGEFRETYLGLAPSSRVSEILNAEDGTPEEA